jgi:hypothetical protein
MLLAVLKAVLGKILLFQPQHDERTIRRGYLYKYDPVTVLWSSWSR